MTTSTRIPKLTEEQSSAALTALGTLAHNRSFTRSDFLDYLRFDRNFTGGGAEAAFRQLLRAGLIERIRRGEYFPTPEGWLEIEKATTTTPPTPRTMYVVMVILDNSCFTTKFPISIRVVVPPAVGYLPIYPTREDAEREWPNREILEIQGKVEG